MKQSRAGALREIVAFESRTALDDGYGNEIAGPFAEQFTANAQITPLRGGESVIADRLQGTQPVVITVRYNPHALTVRDDWQARNVRTGEIYQIKSGANQDEKRQYMQFMAVRGVGG